MADISPADVVCRRSGDSGEFDVLASIEMLGIKIDSFSTLSSNTPKVGRTFLVSPSITCKSPSVCSAEEISIASDKAWEIDSIGKSSTLLSSLKDDARDELSLSTEDGEM